MKWKGLGTLALLLLVAMIWGFAFVAQVTGVEYVGPYTLNGTRFVLGAVSLIPVMLFFERGRVERVERVRTVKASVLSGASLFLASTFQQLGIVYTGSAGVSGFLTGIYVVMVPIAGFLFFRRRTSLHVWIGAFCVLGGLFLLCFRPGQGFSFGIGELLLLIGAVFWTVQILTIDRMAVGVRSLHFAFGQFSVAAVLGVIAMFLLEEPTWEGIWAAKGAIAYCGILSVGVAYTLQIIAQKRADPTFAVVVMSTESVFSAIGGVLFGIDSISLLGYLGCGWIFAGIVVSQLPPKKKKEPPSMLNHPPFDGS